MASKRELQKLIETTMARLYRELDTVYADNLADVKAESNRLCERVKKEAIRALRRIAAKHGGFVVGDTSHVVVECVDVRYVRDGAVYLGDTELVKETSKAIAATSRRYKAAKHAVRIYADTMNRRLVIEGVNSNVLATVDAFSTRTAQSFWENAEIEQN